MKLEILNLEYLKYLQDLAYTGMKKDYGRYDFLLEYLFSIPFYYDMRRFPRDENRLMDGKKLQEDFLLDEFQIPLSSETGKKFLKKNDCSVLEMLLALSIRADLEYTGDGSGDGKVDLFWQMLDNLGLLVYQNRRFDDEKVGKILRKWLDRDYDSSGNGSIFPLKRWHSDPKKREILREIDQTEREIWDQMMAFLCENSD